MNIQQIRKQLEEYKRREQKLPLEEDEVREQSMPPCCLPPTHKTPKEGDQNVCKTLLFPVYVYPEKERSNNE